jgi:hypothetical protein
MGIVAYIAVIAPMEIHGVRYGDVPVSYKQAIVSILCLSVAVVALAKQSGEHAFYEKFNSKWATVPLKIVTAFVFLYLVYSLFCASVLSMTWPFYKGVETKTFFWAISIIFPGLIATGILGVLAGILFWRTSARIEKKKAGES